MNVKLSENDIPLNGTITFYQHWQPALESGTYTVSVTQSVSSTDGKVSPESYQSTKTFCVGGERYSLDSSLISAYFPPEGSPGEYSNVLPHLVLTRPTLPWERSPGESKPAGARDENPEDIAPWLGLLLFDEDDPVPPCQSLTLLDLLSPAIQTAKGPGKLPTDTLFPPFPGPNHDELDYGDTWDKQCTVIDLPLALFNQIAPCLDDLKWMAHVRETGVTHQSETHIRKLRAAFTMNEGDKVKTAVLIGNRLPRPGKQSTVHLVSLENYGPYLPGNNGDRSPKIEESTIQKVRLVSLKNWSFAAVSEDHTFNGLLLNLNKPEGSFTTTMLQLPEKNPDPSEAGKTVTNALKMGYAAFNHHTRQGDNTVSWYHGPFVPYDIQESINIPVVSNDQATRYNPDTGMFDVSYAAAWQLGRLLVLQNKDIAEALYDWKRQNVEATIHTAEEEIIKKTLQKIHDPQKPLDTCTLMNETIKNALTGFLNQVAAKEEGENR